LSAGRSTALPTIGAFRLDLTANVLRRLSTNLVDTYTSEGRYLRAFGTPSGTLIAEVTQKAGAPPRLRMHGSAGEYASWRTPIVSMLGASVDLGAFEARAASIPWLAALASRMRGVKPPHYPTLWEAFVNGIVFQQISIHAAASMLAKLVRRLAVPVTVQECELHPFPPPEALLAASSDELRACSLSTAKVRALQAVARALAERTIEDHVIAAMPSTVAIAELTRIQGIGPWTAALVLLRGLGRIDVFPLNDSGVARSMRLLIGDDVAPAEFHAARERLGDTQGMLYYLLLLARLEHSGTITP